MVQDSLSMTEPMFFRIGLETNLKKTKARVCTSGLIWGKWREQAHKKRAILEGATFCERNRLRLSCTKGGVAVEQSYLKHHMTSLHGICVPQTRGVDKKGEVPAT